MSQEEAVRHLRQEEAAMKALREHGGWMSAAQVARVYGLPNGYRTAWTMRRLRDLGHVDCLTAGNVNLYRIPAAALSADGTADAE